MEVSYCTQRRYHGKIACARPGRISIDRVYIYSIYMSKLQEYVVACALDARLWRGAEADVSRMYTQELTYVVRVLYLRVAASKIDA